MSTALSFRAFAALLAYPEADLQRAIPEIRACLSADSELQALTPLLDHLERDDLITLQEDYVQTFDRNPRHSLHLFEHIHGEDRARGQAMVDLLKEYQTRGFEPAGDELPDYVPLFLEFLSVIPAEDGLRLLGEAVHVLGHLANQLAESRSPYAAVVAAAVVRSPVLPEPLIVPPIRDMDEALETFGPSVEGVEPLLKPTMPGVATVNFYPKGHRQHHESNGHWA